MQTKLMSLEYIYKILLQNNLSGVEMMMMSCFCVVVAGGAHHTHMNELIFFY